jgi:hypothetical protein
VSDEESQEDTLAHQALGTMHLGIPPWAKRFPALAKCSHLQAALQAAGSQGKDTAGFKFYPVLERPEPIDPGMQYRFHDQATDCCQWAQDLTPQVVSEGRNEVFRVWRHCREQAGLRGLESWPNRMPDLPPKRAQPWPGAAPFQHCHHCKSTLAIAGANLPLSLFCEPFALTF